MTPTPPADLPELIRRTARVSRISGYGTTLVIALPLVAIGLGAWLDDAPVLGATLVGLGVLSELVVMITLRRRYGTRGERWERRLHEAAERSDDWREVDVWFVRPGVNENERSQRTALVAELGSRPHLASKLLVTAGADLEPGRAHLWSSAGPGRPALLEKDGQPLWPARPAQGRIGVRMARFAAAVPLSTLTLDRPDR